MIRRSKKAELEVNMRQSEGDPITLQLFEKAVKRLIQAVDVRWLTGTP